MDYELAKQLRDAGWPQNRRDGNWAWPREYDDTKTAAEIRCAIPTLEELIEATPQLDCVTRMSQGKELGYWAASCRSDFSGLSSGFTERTGATPTEAVARLWLVLNAKSV